MNTVCDRDWPEDFEHENGEYMNTCCECKNTFTGHKRRFICKACSTSQGGEAVEVVGYGCPGQMEVLKHVPLTGGMKVSGREREKYSEPLMTVAQHQRILAASVGSAQPDGWHTEDHLTDKSATTYDPEVAKRWRAKGWPVTPLYTHPADQVADDLTMVKVSRELLQDMRDLAFDQVEHHRAAMGAYKQTRQSAMDSVLAQADALLEMKP